MKICIYTYVVTHNISKLSLLSVKIGIYILKCPRFSVESSLLKGVKICIYQYVNYSHNIHIITFKARNRTLHGEKPFISRSELIYIFKQNFAVVVLLK